MHFTVNLRSEEPNQDDFSYGLVFIPCPVWVKGSNEILNVMTGPQYYKGSLAKLIKAENLLSKLSGNKTACVLIHNIGHGSISDFKTLIEDLSEEGFKVKVYGEIN